MGAGATVKPENPRYIALNTAAGVKRLLADYHALSERRFTGDVDASVILLDLKSAISKAGLTVRQAEALRLVYVEDLTLESAGKLMGGTTKQAVDQHVDNAVEAIAEIYYYWSGHNEGYEGEVI
jgi:DNA-directed RNA polymerase specialized sigma24 family protein